MAEVEIPVSPFTSRNPSRTFKAGRVCIEEGCDTPLSMYNPAKICGNHSNGPLRTLPVTPAKKNRKNANGKAKTNGSKS